MCDVLKQSAEAYRELSRYAYTIIGGRKGKQITVEIRFPVDAYHHLAGFQYSRIEALKEQKTALDKVISGEVSARQLQDSGFKHMDRLPAICDPKVRLEENRFVFRYRGYEQPFSMIRAEYLFSFDDVVMFVDDSIPVSIFQNVKNVKYEKGCPQYTVLQIKRTNLTDNQEEILFQRESYKGPTLHE